MFEDVCLTCGKHLHDARLAYCTDDCQFLDTESPSISSASSAVSSPSLGYATGADVPALVPSTLGSALRTYSFSRRHGYSLSSSSASSTSWSLLTDDEGNESDPAVPVSSYGSNSHGSVDSFCDGTSKAATLADHWKSSALSYARRPSGTNNHSTVSNPHTRMPAPHVPHVPRSAPLQSHFFPDDDSSATSDFAFSSRDESDAELSSPKPATKQKRNRASLPAYFSLLQMSSTTDQKRYSSMSSGSGTSLSRRTPSTPKLDVNASLTLSTSTIPSLSTPRGRRRLQEEPSQSSNHSDNSSSPSQSRSRSRRGRRLFSTGENAVVTDVARGRTAGRKSSPPPKMTPGDRHYPPEFRGRAKIPSDFDAPGLGHGRSGLRDRATRSTRVV